MKENIPESWKDELKKMWKSLMEMGWIAHQKKSPTPEDVELELKSYFWLEDYISNLLTTQRSRDRAELAEKICASVRKTPLGKDNTGAELYRSGSGDLQFNQGVDAALDLLITD